MAGMYVGATRSSVGHSRDAAFGQVVRTSASLDVRPVADRAPHRPVGDAADGGLLYVVGHSLGETADGNAADRRPGCLGS